MHKKWPDWKPLSFIEYMLLFKFSRETEKYAPK